MGFVNALGRYYEGNRMCPSDFEVPDKPSNNHFLKDGKWRLDLDKLKMEREMNIRAFYSKQLSLISIGISPQEKDLFDKQAQEAKQFTIDLDESTVPLISSLASISGITVHKIAQKIIDKDHEFRLKVGVILGKQKKVLDKLKTAFSEEEIMAVRPE